MSTSFTYNEICEVCLKTRLDPDLRENAPKPLDRLALGVVLKLVAPPYCKVYLHDIVWKLADDIAAARTIRFPKGPIDLAAEGRSMEKLKKEDAAGTKEL